MLRIRQFFYILLVMCLAAQPIFAINSNSGIYEEELLSTVVIDQKDAQGSESATTLQGVKNERFKFRSVSTFIKKIAKNPKPPNPNKTGAGMAVAALICGIVSLFVFGIILGILACVFGGIALSKYREGLHSRKGMSIVGIVLGIIGIIGALVVIALRSS